MVKKWKTDFSELHDKTRNAFRAPSFNFPLNKGLTLLLAVIIVVGGLSYFGVYKPGKYTAILKQNTTELQTQLDECNSNYQSCSDDLATSKASLIEKSNALSTCNTNFDDCDKKKKEYLSELTYYERHYDKDCAENLDDCEYDLKNCDEDLYDYQAILSIDEAEDFDHFIDDDSISNFFDFLDEDYIDITHFDELEDGVENLQQDYAKYYCCCEKHIYDATNTTYYKFGEIDDSTPECSNSTGSERNPFDCTEVLGICT